MPSLSSVLTTVLALSASALAYTTPTTFNVTTNPIYTPNEGSIVPVGKPYKITWGPTNSGTVTILLLRGPSENAVPLYAIAEKIKNSGSYSWTPKTDLEDDESRYGLQLIIDANGQYQYSTQFGISNPDYEGPSSSASGYETAEPTTTSYETVDVTSKSYQTSLVTVTTPPIKYNTTTAYPTYVPPSQNYTATYTPPTASEEPSDEPEETDTTTAAAPSQTGAAASIKVASGLLLGVAGAAVMLL